MARVSLKEDARLTKKGLLRPSVVAWLLGVAPKTIHAWKDLPVKKIHGIKYLRWHDIRAKCSDAWEILDLPSDASDAYCKWVEKKPHTIIAKPIVSVAASAIEKAKALLSKQVTKATATEVLVEAPVIVDDSVLDVPDEYKHLVKDKLPAVTDACEACPHSKSKFHTKLGCKFGKNTVVECKCKKGN